METNRQMEMPTRIERYELKYMIPLEWIPAMCDFIAIYCTLDKYSQIEPDGFYQVTNLYLDSPDYQFLKRRLAGLDNRFNMRVRAYGNHYAPPYFPEIKHKINGIVRKYRTTVNDRNWYRAYTAPGFESAEQPDDPTLLSNQRLFERLVYSHLAAPKILTQYLRQAWISECDAYARVTFDKGLRYMVQNDYELTPIESEMIPCDGESLFDPGCSVILELKCNASQVPLWMLDFIKTFNLQRCGFSKYAGGAIELFGQYKNSDGGRMASAA